MAWADDINPCKVGRILATAAHHRADRSGPRLGLVRRNEKSLEMTESQRRRKRPLMASLPNPCLNPGRPERPGAFTAEVA